MANEEMPAPKNVLRGATDTGCGSWAPIFPSEVDSRPQRTTVAIDPATTPDAATDVAAAVPENSQAER